MYKKSVFLFSCIFFAYITISFKGHRNQPKLAVGQKNTILATKQQVPTSENLYLLYLSNAELKVILDNASDSNVVFQFFHDDNNKLSLAPWPRSRKYFDKKYAVPLHETETVMDIITNKKVHLGNVNIEKSEYDDLITAVKLVTPDNKIIYPFFLFVPKIPNYDPSKINHIYYEIYGDVLKPTLLKAMPPNAVKITTANPSPPRPAN